jgi:hypothetical protein
VTGEERKSATSQPAPKTEVLQRSVFDLGWNLNSGELDPKLWNPLGS